MTIIVLPVAIILVSVWCVNSNFIDILFERNSTSIRLESIIVAFIKARENFFMGSGLGQGLSDIRNSMILDSTFMNLLVDTGIVGVFLFLLMNAKCFINIFRRACQNSNYQPYLEMLLILLIEMIAESILYNSLLSGFIGIIWSIGMRYSEIENNLILKKSNDFYIKG